MSIRYSFFATLLLVAATLQADPMLDAEKIYHQGNYDKAYTEMRSLAKKGEVDAQYYLGAMLVDGLGVDANSKKASIGLSRRSSKSMPKLPSC